MSRRSVFTDTLTLLSLNLVQWEPDPVLEGHRLLWAGMHASPMIKWYLLVIPRNAHFLENMLVCKLPEGVFLFFSCLCQLKVFSFLERRLERDCGGGKCSVWKNPSSIASHSHNAQNTSLQKFKTCSKNQKLQLCYVVRKEQEGLKVCWRP